VIPEYSFPSGHAMNSFVYYGALALVVWAVWGRGKGLIACTAAGFIVLAVGVSRVYLGHHYFSDVLGGYSGGLLWLFISATAVEGGRGLRPSQRSTTGATYHTKKRAK